MSVGPGSRLAEDAAAAPVAVDRQGRSFVLRRLNALDKLRLFEAAGAELARNDRWLGMAALAASVTEIDGVPYPAPAGKAAIESMIRRMGDDGVAAVAAALAEPAPDPVAMRDLAGN